MIDCVIEAGAISNLLEARSAKLSVFGVSRISDTRRTCPPVRLLGRIAEEVGVSLRRCGLALIFDVRRRS